VRRGIGAGGTTRGGGGRPRPRAVCTDPPGLRSTPCNDIDTSEVNDLSRDGQFIICCFRRASGNAGLRVRDFSGKALARGADLE